MKAQTAQTSTSTRPQQPTAAYAATLPVETLARIFELALQHFVWPNEEKGQAQRVKFGLVCRSWCSAALPLPHYIISSSSKAQRLTDLLRTTDRSRQAVRSLDIVAEKDKGSGRGERIAKLLKMCPNLARVTIQVDRDQDGSLGKVVQDVLASLDLVAFEFYGDQLPVPVLQRLLKEWPQLTDLTIWISYSYSRDTLVLPSSSHLRSLSLPAVTNLNLTKALIAATPTTLEVLNVGEVYPSKGEELLAVIKPVSAQLV